MHYCRTVESLKWIVAIILIALALIYLPGLKNEFVTLDDNLLIYKNPIVQGMTSYNMRAAFTHYDPELYIPLTFLSYQFDYMIAGFSPIIYHLTNLLLHTLNVFLVGALIFLLTKKRGAAFCCALLFAVHPLNVEAVAWAAARKDLLSAWFFLISLCLYFYNQNRIVALSLPAMSKAEWSKGDNSEASNQYSNGLYWISVTAFALGLMAKVSILMLPIILLLLPLWERRRITKQDTTRTLPFFGLSVIFGIVALFGKQHLLVTTTLLEKLLMACKSLTTYVWKLIAPIKLSVLYPQLDPIGFSPDFIIAIIFSLVFIGAIIFWCRKSPRASFALAFFAITLLPTFTNFSKNGFLYFASDRYVYLPSIGLFLFTALIISHWLDRSRWPWQQWKLMIGFTSLGFILLLGLSMKQVRVWQNDTALYTHVIQTYPQAAVAWNNLGTMYFDRTEYDEALEHYQIAAKLGPNFIEAHANIGNVYLKRNNNQRAIEAFKKAVTAIPDSHLTADDLIPYYFLGQMYDLENQPDLALEQFQTAAERGQEFSEPHQNLALMYQKYHQLDQAILAYQTAIATDAHYVPARYNLAAILASQGNIPAAIAHLEVIEQVQPGYQKTRDHLAAMRKQIKTNN